MKGNPFSGVQFNHVPFFSGDLIEAEWEVIRNSEMVLFWWDGRDEERALEAEGTEGKFADEIDSQEQGAGQSVGAGGGAAVPEPGG